MLDMRGWGYLTGKGSEALGMDEDTAAKIQDNIGKRTADLLNADVTAHNDRAEEHCPVSGAPQRKETNQ